MRCESLDPRSMAKRRWIRPLAVIPNHSDLDAYMVKVAEKFYAASCKGRLCLAEVLLVRITWPVCGTG